MSYDEKIDFQLNDLQKVFFRLFRKTFPSLVDRINIIKSDFKHQFQFSIRSDSDYFGELMFYVDDIEITVGSRFDHKHFGTYDFDSISDRLERAQLTSIAAIDYVKEFISCQIVIEYKENNNKIVSSFQYYKGNPTETFSATIFMREENEEYIDESKTVTRKVTWCGPI